MIRSMNDINLKPHEIKLIAKLLEMASDKFSNHGCNDFDLVKEAGLTSEEAHEVNRGFASWNDPNWSNEYDEEDLLVDHAIAGDDGMMSYMSARVKAQLTEDGEIISPVFEVGTTSWVVNDDIDF